MLVRYVHVCECECKGVTAEQGSISKVKRWEKVSMAKSLESWPGARGFSGFRKWLSPRVEQGSKPMGC